jgi:hypothetical protein
MSHLLSNKRPSVLIVLKSKILYLNKIMRYIFSGKFRLQGQTKILIQYTLKKLMVLYTYQYTPKQNLFEIVTWASIFSLSIKKRIPSCRGVSYMVAIIQIKYCHLSCSPLHRCQS